MSRSLLPLFFYFLLHQLEIIYSIKSGLKLVIVPSACGVFQPFMWNKAFVYVFRMHDFPRHLLSSMLTLVSSLKGITRFVNNSRKPGVYLSSQMEDSPGYYNESVLRIPLTFSATSWRSASLGLPRMSPNRPSIERLRRASVRYAPMTYHSPTIV